MVKFGANYKFESGLPDTVAPARTARPAEPSEDEGLAQKSQNPIADLVSVPFQSNTNFNAGPFNQPRKCSTFSQSCRCTSTQTGT